MLRALIISVMILSAQPQWAQAQAKKAAQAPADPGPNVKTTSESAAENVAPKVKVEKSASGQKVFRITEGIVVEGRLQKPNAFYVLQRSSIDYDWEALHQGFLQKIVQSTGQSPF